ncbi:MAG: S-adenosylmethionine decarboxylase [Candidatus Pacebacteria bacterium]|nr:S-adenosylmethionine decarboxylase [Candidatus Paceibacterota bacterium]
MDRSIPLIKHFVALIKMDPFDSSGRFIESLAQKVIGSLDLKVVQKFEHTFKPDGITLGFVLAQSHLVIHTWPESGTIHIDLVACSPIKEKKFKQALISFLDKQNIQLIEVKAVNFF